MTAIKTLQKRLDHLEGRPTTEPDIVEMVLTTLKDADLDLLQEVSCLREAGFDEQQTAAMMGDHWSQYLEAATRFQAEYARITGEPGKRTEAAYAENYRV